MLEFQSFQPRLGETLLLSPLSASVEAGSFVVLSAPSGAGKSRLLETLRSPGLPFEGRFDSREPDVSIPQSLDLCRTLTAAENVAAARVALLPFWKTIGGFPRGELTRARAWLSAMGLENQDVPTSRLSGGEQQRVALARVLNSDRKLWLLDEPVSQLDDRAAIACLRRLKVEARERRAGVFCVLHQESVAAAVADRFFRWDRSWTIE